MRIFILLLLGTLCFSRENPFAPVENISKSTQPVRQDKQFDRAYLSLPDSARILKKLDVYYQNLDGSVSHRSVSIDKKIDWHNEFIFSYKNSGNIKNTRVKSLSPKSTGHGIKRYKYKDFIAFQVGNKRMKIITKDSKIRDFMVDNPYKIVIDFRRDTNFLTKTFKVRMPPFVSIVLGNHDKYYRVVVTLDGQYLYNLKKDKGDYVITLK